MTRAVAPLLLLAVLATACNELLQQPARTARPEPTAAGEVAFELASPGEAAMTVPVTINGKGPFTFVVDTGATITCVSDEIASELDLPESRMRGIGATVGSSGNIRLVEVESLEIGDATVKDITACTVDLSSVKAIGITADGLLGLNVLKNFDVAIDFERQIMRLSDPDDAAAAETE